MPTKDGAGIQWDHNEKFYCWLEWLEYIVEHHLKPWGYLLNGEVRWQGEGEVEVEGQHIPDAGVLYVRDNRLEAVFDRNPGPSWGRRFVPAP